MKKSFTLIEVLGAALIVAVTFAGLIASFNASRVYIIRSSKRVMAANIARSKINTLNAEVRADTWDNPGSELEPGIVHTFGDPSTDDYYGSYTVADIPVGGDVGFRKVTMTINYPEE